MAEALGGFHLMGTAESAENAKPEDLVSIGFGLEDEVSESVALAEKLF